MKVKTGRGTVMESHNETVIEMWRQAGLEELPEEAPKQEKPAAEKPKRTRKAK